ncbi:YerC/YecD family TrpR-related protein [Alicyclobacillus fastidiosus]|uniref:YerC/YecD family TrpR-related protein n=1 Tax=Alicyclobacillus fastidiosus TaxID=392011 RepID=A0ABY6ZIV5_9BACL|nr:YerC/YecD family TrpR-related protein [Alicyclobacillus fastidiosus]WAH42859.1 YerC/YecD family TrpR-related protein [Alicyclobacillus fastidiosus]GMA64794.1 hypothetical protein GCM10025859_52340 [Alicyclobacillus fastidiosus]
MTLDKLRSKDIERLFQAILALNSEDECFKFFDDICTIGEIQSLAQRLEVARMLREGATYHAIEAKTGASTATISRVKRCLHYGSDGYRLILDRLDGPVDEPPIHG